MEKGGNKHMVMTRRRRIEDNPRPAFYGQGREALETIHLPPESSWQHTSVAQSVRVASAQIRAQKDLNAGGDYEAIAARLRDEIADIAANPWRPPAVAVHIPPEDPVIEYESSAPSELEEYRLEGETDEALRARLASRLRDLRNKLFLSAITDEERVLLTHLESVAWLRE